jgi:hypothetical protein
MDHIQKTQDHGTRELLDIDLLDQSTDHIWAAEQKNVKGTTARVQLFAKSLYSNIHAHVCVNYAYVNSISDLHGMPPLSTDKSTINF